jgi:Zn-dependent protease/CBS domain-containing protein
MRGAFKLGNVAGIGIYIHWTFAILIIFIIFSNYQSGNNTQQIAWAVLFVLSIFVTVFLHELGHALAAKRYNIKTKDITMLPIGGLARLESIPEKPFEELVVAIAGPAVNIALALFTGLFITLPNTEVLVAELSNGVNAHNFFLNFLVVNVWLALFNLIPAFPMDGGRVLRALLAMKFERHIATNIAARIGQLLAIGFIFLGFYGNPMLIFIGFFIFLGAQAEAQMVQTKSMLMGYTVKNALIQQYQTIEATEPVSTAVHLLLNSQYKTFLVTQNSYPVGTLNRDDIIRALSQKGDAEPVAFVMDTNLVFIDAHLPLEEAYQQMQQQQANFVLVKENDRFIGIVDNENILEFILVKSALAQKRG